MMLAKKCEPLAYSRILLLYLFWFILPLYFKKIKSYWKLEVIKYMTLKETVLSENMLH